MLAVERNRVMTNMPALARRGGKRGACARLLLSVCLCTLVLAACGTHEESPAEYKLRMFARPGIVSAAEHMPALTRYALHPAMWDGGLPGELSGPDLALQGLEKEETALAGASGALDGVAADDPTLDVRVEQELARLTAQYAQWLRALLERMSHYYPPTNKQVRALHDLKLQMTPLLQEAKARVATSFPEVQP